MDNIRYGKLDATDDDCIAAAKLAGADDAAALDYPAVVEHDNYVRIAYG